MTSKVSSSGAAAASVCRCRVYQVVFCYNIIERNNRHMLPVVRNSAGGDSVTTNTNPLDSFFPFDPYLLKRCVPNDLGPSFSFHTALCASQEAPSGVNNRPYALNNRECT